MNNFELDSARVVIGGSQQHTIIQQLPTTQTTSHPSPALKPSGMAIIGFMRQTALAARAISNTTEVNIDPVRVAINAYIDYAMEMIPSESDPEIDPIAFWHNCVSVSQIFL